MKITAPDSSYSGESRYGETVLTFKDGVATFDADLPHGVRQYLEGAGYGIGSKKPAEPEETPAPPDPRELGTDGDGIVQLGTPLRDAAVDPHPEDFLPPINAGKPGPEGNPHGPNVVSPQIHASSGQAVVPGPVGHFEVEDVKDEDGNVTGKRGVVTPDPDVQQERESEFAQRALADNEPVPEVLADMGKKAEGTDAPGEAPAVELKGAALDDALEEAGLPKTGTADEKRQRLAEHRGEA